MLKIYIPQPIAPEGEQYLIERGYEIFRGSGKTDRISMKQDIADCDAMILRTAKVDQEVIEAGEHLKVIARHGAGYDNLDYKLANQRGIQTTYSPFSTGSSVAEFTMAVILNLAKGIGDCSKQMEWGSFHYKLNHKGEDVCGKTLAVIGFGEIGSRVAQKAYRGFDMKVIAYVPRPEGKIIPDYVSVVEWEELFLQADYVSLHIPGKPENQKLIGRYELERMKPTAYIINASRGGILDEEAFIWAVQNKVIAGGALDVFEQEPLAADSPLFGLEHVLLTPHMGSNTKECMARIALDTAVDVDLVLKGKEPRYPIQ